MRFRATEPFQFPDGSTGWRPGGPMDCLGPFAKIENCLIDGTELRKTVYATGYSDTFFSVPARCSHKGKYVSGYITLHDESPVFVPNDQYKPAFEESK